MFLFKKRRVHCIGDSHVAVFEYLSHQQNKYKLRNIDFHFCIVQGATNMGLANPHSKTEAMPIFRRYLENVKKEDVIILMLGEVDCGFVIWYRAEKYGLPVESQFEISLNNYKDLIYSIRKITGDKVIICSVPLPTIKDDVPLIGDVANKRMAIKTTQKERSSLTIKYNEELKKMCAQMNIYYLDFQDETLDPFNGVVLDLYLNEIKTDHHLSNKQLSRIIYPKLKLLLKSITSQQYK